MSDLRTTRLRLVPGTVDIFDADMASQLAAGNDGALRDLLGVEPIAEWPPFASGHDLGAVDFFRSNLVKDPAAFGWSAYYVCLGKTLVGSAGYFGPPNNGEVEIGYSICTTHRRQGIALEAVSALVARASAAGAKLVRAHTLPTNSASIALLAKAGFVEAAPDDEEHLLFMKVQDKSDWDGIGRHSSGVVTPANGT